MSNPYGECDNNPVLDVPQGNMAVRVCFPYEVNSMNPIVDPQTGPYDPGQLLRSQISSFIPGMLKVNFIEGQCDIIIVPDYEARYLIKTYPEIFSQYN